MTSITQLSEGLYALPKAVRLYVAGSESELTSVRSVRQQNDPGIKQRFWRTDPASEP